MKIPIVFSVTDNFVKYVSVTIYSIYTNNIDDEFWIYIFYMNISNDNQIKLLNMQNERLHINLIDVHGIIESKLLFVDGHVTEETYYRLLIPELLPHWDKVLYLDSDLVCLGNISELYKIDIGKNWVGGVVTVGNEKRAEYCRIHLGITSERYINAGVLIFNNIELRKIEWKKRWISCIKDKGYLKWHDQDLINTICFNHIFFLDPKWNTTILRIKLKLDIKTEKEIKIKDLNCCIFHYASLKPWETEMMEINLPFWRYAYHTPFVTDIISEYEKISNSKKHFVNMCKEGSISINTLLNCIKYSFSARIKKYVNDMERKR